MTLQLGMCRVLFDFIDAKQEFNMRFPEIIGDVLQGYLGDSADEAFWSLCERLSDRHIVE
jgi:hypothetical protein